MRKNTNVFIAGTDTNVGKTIASAWLCIHTNARYWKPIQTGNDSDSGTIRKLSPHTEIIPELYKLRPPLSPYDAAKLGDVSIDLSLFKREIGNVVVEGTGGVLVPVAPGFHMVDLIKFCGAEAVIVAKSRLGVINHVLMTAEILRSRNIGILGIVVNGAMGRNVWETIELFSGLKIIANIPNSDSLGNTLRSIDIPPEIRGIIA
jgi:dethiobiotin synthase